MVTALPYGSVVALAPVELVNLDTPAIVGRAWVNGNNAIAVLDRTTTGESAFRTCDQLDVEPRHPVIRITPGRVYVFTHPEDPFDFTTPASRRKRLV